MDHTPKAKSPSVPLVAGESGLPLAAQWISAADKPVSLTVTGNVPITGFASMPTTKPLDLDFEKLAAVLSPALIPPAIEAAEGYLELITKPAVALGITRRKRRQFALKAYRLAKGYGICLGSDSHEARRQLVLGYSLRLLGRHRMALSAFRLAALHRGSRVEALMGIGWCQKRLNDLTGAVSTLTRALAIEPDNARLHYNLACYLSLCGQFRAAIYELAWAVELEPRLRRRAVCEPDLDALRAFPAFSSLTDPARSA